VNILFKSPFGGPGSEGQPTFFQKDPPCGAGCGSIELNDEQKHHLVCIHQAGHAVFLLYFCHEVGPSGIWIDRDGGGCDCTELQDSAAAAFMILAGTLAEWEWVFPGSQLAATDYESARHDTHHLINAGYGCWSDATRVMRLADKLQPSNPDEFMTRLIMGARNVLRDSGVWNSILNVARQLHHDRSMGTVEVMAVIEGVLGYELMVTPSGGEVGLSFGLRKCRTPFDHIRMGIRL
jgi:hypothetical protein